MCNKARIIYSCSFALGILFSLIISVPGIARTPITMWIASQPAGVTAWLPIFVQNFNSTHPTIELQIETYPNLNTTRNKLIVAMAAGVAPDIVYESDNWIPKWVSNGVALSLDKYINGWPDKSQIIPDMLQMAQYNGHYYAIPHIFAPTGDVYNLDMMVNNGLAEPKNWDEIINAAKKLRKMTDSNKVDVYGYVKDIRNGSIAIIDLELALNQLGTTMIKYGDIKAYLNTEAGRKALKFMTDMREAGMSTLPAPSNTTLMTSGKAAIAHYFAGSQYLNSIVAAAKNIKYGFRRYVGPEIGKDMIHINTNQIFITTASKFPDEAWQVLKVFDESENLKTYVRVHGSVFPARTALLSDYIIRSNEGFMELMANVVPPMATIGPLHQDYVDFRETAGNSLIKAIIGEVAPNAALEEAERYINKYIADRMMAAEK